MTSSSYESLSHSRWDCKYHVVFVPKYRKKILYGRIRKFLGPLLHDLASHRSSVAEVIGYMKGKSAISVARQFGARKRNFNGERFWARGYAVSTVGFEEEKIKEYIRNQEQLDMQGSEEKGDF